MTGEAINDGGGALVRHASASSDRISSNNKQTRMRPTGAGSSIENGTIMPAQLDASRKTVLIDLALQGGGSHGAFTWGVLDRLLEESWLRIEAISGTSAGAMEAALLVLGSIKGGVRGAREALDAYWERVAASARYSPIQRSMFDRLM